MASDSDSVPPKLTEIELLKLVNQMAGIGIYSMFTAVAEARIRNPNRNSRLGNYETKGRVSPHTGIISIYSISAALTV